MIYPSITLAFCGEPTVFSSKPDVGKWDWKTKFEITCGDVVLSGVSGFEEAGMYTYALTVLNRADMEWTEGEAVMDSFEIIPNLTREWGKMYHSGSLMCTQQQLWGISCFVNPGNR